ncbi:MAG TPA: AI-2E family transporter [Chloroflexia bacterium]|nr:AI-2E family transporter [Chloroflexia bacterium]
MTETPNESSEQVADEASQAVSVQVETRGPRVPTVIVITVSVLAVVLISYLLYRTLPLLLLLFLALLVATAIEPVVNWLRRGPFTRSAGILIVYTGLFVVIGTVGYILFAVFFSQLGSLATSLDTRVTQMEKDVVQIDAGRPSFLRDQAVMLTRAARGVVNNLKRTDTPVGEKEALEAVTHTTLTLAEIFFAVTTIFVVAYYWLIERTRLKRAFISWFPADRVNRIRRVWDDIEVKVGGWVRGQFILMATVGALSAIGYFAIGLSYWPALALFIALAEAIPLVGPYIGTAPAVIVALTQMGNDGLLGLLGVGDIGPLPRVLLVVVFAVVLQTIEGNVLIPRVMKHSVGISPLTVIISIIFGGVIAGLAGALVAVPLSGAIQVVVQDIKAAHESEAKFEALTADAEETRAREGELVTAHTTAGETKTKVENKASARGAKST